MPVNPFDNYPMSWKPSREALEKPYYQCIAKMLEQEILSGILPPETKLPPQRELADFLDVNFTTITRAYKLCEQRGLIYGAIGKGTFVSPQATRPIVISTDKITNELIDLGFVASFEQTNDIVRGVAKQTMDKCYISNLFDYSEPTGIPHHKKAGQCWMNYLGVQTDIEHIAIAAGAQNALAITLTALFQPGDRIATDVFTYSNFITLAKMLHIKLVPVKGDHQGMSPDELDNACRQMDIQGVFLMPSCSNPTTIMISDARKQQLADVIRRRDLILIEDDIHAFLTAGLIDDYKQPMFELLPDHAIYICGTSRSICSGLRVAYLVYGERFASRISQALFIINVKTSSLDAEIVSDVLNTGKAVEILSMKKMLAKKANQTYDEYFYARQPYEHPYSFYRWLPLRHRVSGAALEEELEQQNIRVYHSSRFLIGQEPTQQYLRIALATTRNCEELRKGLFILKKYLVKHGLDECKTQTQDAVQA